MERDIVDRLRDMAGPIKPNICTDAADEIERLRAERDEARQIWCRYRAFFQTKAPRDVAAEQGWDCFKEAAS